MVLLAILAGSLLQLARFERIPRAQSNIDVVIESVVDEILNQATDDLLDANGDFLNTQFTPTNDGGDEPIDFPYTNRTVTGIRTPENRNGVPQANVLGGLMDDTWLAAHMPDFGTVPATGNVYSGGGAGGTNGIWRKITSLTGLWVGGAAGSADLSTQAIPREDPVSNLAVALNSDTNIPTNSALLVDSDGDGIGDSRWEWAPLRQVDATQYVMAVRIVDLSARMDVNVATRIHGDTGPTATSFSGANLGVGLPRGDSPADLDGSGFVAQTADAAAAINGTTARNEWLRALRHRLTGSGTAAINPLTSYDGNATTPTLGSRRDLWTKGASRVSNTFSPNGEDPAGTFNYSSGSTFSLVDAYELLQGNGLNSATATPLEDLMPTFLRSSATPENGYGAGAGPSPNGWNQRQFWELDPRKHISPFAGSSVAAKPVTTGQARQLKIDVNEAVKTSAGRNTLRNRINTFLNTNGTGLVNLFPHLNQAGLADQLTANIADYIDDDNTVTTVGGKTGFEALPYITEIYTQRIYDGTVTPNATDLTTSTIDWTVDTADNVGYIIEIGNPFGRQVGGNWVGRPISLDNVFLGFNGTRDSNDLAHYAGKSTLNPGEVLIVYRNSSGNDNDGTQDTLSNYLSHANNNGSANITPVPGTLTTQGPAMPSNVSEFRVSLHAAEQGTTTSASWAYNACEVEIGGTSLPQETIDATNYTAGTTYQTYVQTSYRGVGEGLRMMAVNAEPTNTNGYFEDNTTLGSPQTNTTVPTAPAQPNEGHATRSISTWLDNESKQNAPAGFSSLANQQIVWPDNERERMHWIGDILQIPIIGPDRGATGNATNMAKAFADAAATPGRLNTDGIPALYLPYQRYSAAPVPAAPVVNNNTSTGPASGSRFGIYNYPHALLLLEQLTTFSPATDGRDGDNADGDNNAATGGGSIASPDEGEVLVPGKLNLNTAPRETLVRLLPFPDLTTRQRIADAIIARRESMNQNTAYGTGANNIPGIAYTTALYEQIENLHITTNATNNEGDTTTLASSGVRIDLNDYEDRGALNDYNPGTAGIQYPGLADGIADDREEEIMLAKWLTEVADTRSDIFAAYIVVQGYPIDNFDQGAVESARLIVLFSRAGVKGTGDKAVEIGRLRIN